MAGQSNATPDPRVIESAIGFEVDVLVGTEIKKGPNPEPANLTVQGLVNDARRGLTAGP